MRARPLARAAALLAALALLAPHGAEGAKKKRRRSSSRAIPVVPRAPDPFRVTIPTPDGVALAASWRPVPGAPDAPAVLLLHEFSRDRREWDALVPELAQRGLATLALDLRGHGESTRKGGAVVKLTPRLMTDPAGFPRDVEAAGKWLRGRTAKVGAMGLALGANLVVLATASGWADAGVALSATTDRLAPLAGGRPTKPEATLFVASEEDPGRAAAAQELSAKEGEPRKLIVVPGSAHNLALFGEHPRTKEEAYAWLVERLGATPLAPAPTPVPATAHPEAITRSPGGPGGAEAPRQQSP